MLQIPVLAFADAFLDGEAAHAPFVTVRGEPPPAWDGYYIRRLPPDVLHAQYRGQALGIVPIFLPHLAPVDGSEEAVAAVIRQTEHLCALLFVHDMPNMWGFRAHAPTIHTYWQAMDRFGMVGVDCLPYWRSAGRVASSHPDVKVTVYRKNGQALFVAANLGEEDARTDVRLDCDALGLPGGKGRVWDAISEETLDHDGDMVTLAVPALGLRMVRWGPGGPPSN
jgi:hypothetical protein